MSIEQLQDKQETLRYPIGRFQRIESPTPEQRTVAIHTLEHFPARLRAAVAGLDETQLETPYRDGGWTVRQVVHHLADSHLMAILRMRLALTEDWPSVPAYNEHAFAQLLDASAAPIGISLALLEALHARWIILLRSLSSSQLQRGFLHSEAGRRTIDPSILEYAWHSDHHLAQVTELRARMGW